MELDEVVLDIYKRLIAEQESLGSEFSEVLHDNLWELYERTDEEKNNGVANKKEN